MNYGLTRSIPTLRVRLPGLPIFFAPSKEEQEYQNG
jgi:hypothetical protein